MTRRELEPLQSAGAVRDREQLLREADRLVEEARARAAAAVRQELGPSPREREALLLQRAPMD